MPKPPDKLADAYEEIRNLKNKLHACRGLEEKIATLERQVQLERDRLDYVMQAAVDLIPKHERYAAIHKLLVLLSRTVCVSEPRATGTDEKGRPDVEG